MFLRLISASRASPQEWPQIIWHEGTATDLVLLFFSGSDDDDRGMVLVICQGTKWASDKSIAGGGGGGGEVRDQTRANF